MRFGADFFGAGQTAGAGLPIPGVDLVSPASGATISGRMPIMFEVVDQDDGVSWLGIWLRFTGESRSSMVWSTAGGFAAAYSDSTLVQPCAQNNRRFQFAIIPGSAWTADIAALTIRAFDSSGNLVVDQGFLVPVC